jgi:hypothetical protein
LIGLGISDFTRGVFPAMDRSGSIWEKWVAPFFRFDGSVKPKYPMGSVYKKGKKLWRYHCVLNYRHKD